MAQLVERSLLTPGVPSSNPVIDELFKNKNKDKEVRNGPFKKQMHLECTFIISDNP